MKQFKGTPAPWNIDTCPVNGFVITNSDESKAVAFLPVNGDHSEANAKLFASAPELLEVLQKITKSDQFNELPCTLQEEITDAITKALGG